MNEELLTVLRELALRSKKSTWWQPWQMAEQTGNDDAEFIAALSPEIVLELLYEIERRHGMQSALLECRTRIRELGIECNKYAGEISMGKAATIALQLALETERSAANMYAKKVAHWIEKHDAILAQQLDSHNEMYAAKP